MTILLFGATGMVGYGALLECLEDARVTEVRAIVRRPTGRAHPKLREIVHADFTDYTGVDLSGIDACLFCLGVSAAGMDEAEYTRVTQGYTLAAARALLAASPGAAFVYVSGQGTNAASRTMWARVKGTLENTLIGMPFSGAYAFRPGYIQPVKGARSATALYRAAYTSLGFLYPLLRAVAPSQVTDSARLGRAMIQAVAERGPSRVVEVAEINRLAG